MKLARILRIGAALAASVAMLPGCRREVTGPDMNPIAERYVKLVLQVGEHDPNLVDAYYGNPAWKPTGARIPLESLAREATTLRAEVQALVIEPGVEELVYLRRDYLDKQLAAVDARIAMLRGTKFSFAEEAERLYDAKPPVHTEQEFEPVLAELEQNLPGKGTLIERYTAFRNRFLIPADRLDVVFRSAIDGCQAKAGAYIALPETESFTIEYVTGKPWSAYNWYKGRFTSVIQVNTELPITIDRALDLACHEGYPGHHVYNVLLEKNLVRDRGWVEFSIYPLFSPQSLIAEGTANFGIDMAFPGEARVAFERDRLYPLARLDPATASEYSVVQRLVNRLSYAGNEAARRYLDGQIDRNTAVAWLQKYAMQTKDRALQRTQFFDQYRSYVINYNLGQDLVRRYLENRGGTVDAPDTRWLLFAELLSSPRLPSGLR